MKSYEYKEWVYVPKQKAKAMVKYIQIPKDKNDPTRLYYVKFEEGVVVQGTSYGCYQARDLRKLDTSGQPIEDPEAEKPVLPWWL